MSIRIEREVIEREVVVCDTCGKACTTVHITDERPSGARIDWCVACWRDYGRERSEQ